MKYVIIGIVVVALVIAGFWGYAKYRKSKPSTSTSPVVSFSVAPTPVVVISQTPTPIDTNLPPIGNTVGRTAPDFQLQGTSLKSYRGRSGVIIWIRPYNTCDHSTQLDAYKSRYPGYSLMLISRGSNMYSCGLYDGADAIHRLYGTNEQSYFIIVGIDGVIQETFVSQLR